VSATSRAGSTTLTGSVFRSSRPRASNSLW
jgi:hypothetical protein